MNLFTRITPLIFRRYAQTIVVLTGGIDLSVGSIIGLTNVIAASLPFVDTPQNILLWACIPPLVGLLVGLINGVIITRGGFPPLIVTLATGAIWKGVTLFLMPIPGGEVSLTVAMTATGQLFNSIPAPLVIFTLAVLLCHTLLSKTTFGRSIYAIGGNETIAYQSGIPSKNEDWGVWRQWRCAPLPACFFSAWMFSADPLVGEPYILNSIAVTDRRHCVIRRKRRSPRRYRRGLYLLVDQQYPQFASAISTFYQFVAKGVVLILALAVTSSGASLNLPDSGKNFFCPTFRIRGGETLTWTERKKCSCFFSD